MRLLRLLGSPGFRDATMCWRSDFGTTLIKDFHVTMSGVGSGLLVLVLQSLVLESSMVLGKLFLCLVGNHFQSQDFLLPQASLHI